MTARSIAARRSKPAASKPRISIKKTWPLHVMLVPGVVLVLVFSYIPMAGIVMAFQRFRPAMGPWWGGKQQWAGLYNFEFVLSLPNTMNVLRNTLVMAIGKIVLGTLVSIIFALLLNEIRHRGMRRAIQTTIYFPHFLSWIILSGILVDFLSQENGIVNAALRGLGFGAIPFLTDPKWFPFSMIATDVWKGFGFGTVIYMASIASIDPTLYEAAAIDGAGRWKQTLHVTLPGMQMIIVLLAVLNLGNILNAGFDQIFNMYNSQVLTTGDIIDTLVYRLSIGSGTPQYGVATAIGLFKSAVSMILIASTYFYAYKKLDYTIF